MSKLERDFQSRLIKEIEDRIPDALAFKSEPYIQGFPDILVLREKRWAALECKRSWNAERQPNQEYWVDLLNRMSYAAFIYPENKEEVLDELQRALES